MGLGGVDGTHELREISVDGVKSIELMMDFTSNHSHDIGILAIAITSSLRLQSRKCDASTTASSVSDANWATLRTIYATRTRLLMFREADDSWG